MELQILHSAIASAIRRFATHREWAIDWQLAMLSQTVAEADGGQFYH